LQVDIDTQTGLLTPARQVPSPNCDTRPSSGELTLLVIHGISLPPGEYGGPWIDQLFTNTLNPDTHPGFEEIHTLRVSSHLLIRRDGEIVQYVPFHQRAWHAGQSTWCGKEGCNDFSIGIELEGTDTDNYEPIQYEYLSLVCNALIQAYPALADTNIVGHSDIAPGRKTDPGEAFDWQAFRRQLKASRIS